MTNTELLIAVIIFAASFVQGFSGFGFALISIPFLTMLIDIKMAVPLGAICGLVVNIYLTGVLRSHFNYKELGRMFFGSLLGIPVGSWVLNFGPSEALKDILGVVVILFALSSIFQIIKPVKTDSRWGYFAGLCSGILGGAFNTNGPPVLIYFFLKGWDKVNQKAMITGFFLAASTVIVISHAVTGLTTNYIFMLFLKLLPVVLAGIIIGNSLFNKISTELFNKVLLYSLLVLGSLLIIR